MDLSLVLVGYGAPEDARRALASAARVFGHLGDGLEAIVVDNAGPVPVRPAVEGLAIRQLENERNVGFARAANQAAAEATGEFLLFLNPDTYMPDDSPRDLLQAAKDDEGGGLFGPQLVTPDGARAPCCGYFHFRVRRLVGRVLGRAATPVLSGRTPVDWVAATAAVVRRSVWQAVGGFSDDYFMYFEDVDLCYRLWRLGRPSYVVPSAQVVHAGSASYGRGHGAAKREDYRRSLAHFLRTRGGLRGRLIAPFLDLLAGPRYNRHL